jgi:hypothetical protein
VSGSRFLADAAVLRHLAPEAGVVALSASGPDGDPAFRDALDRPLDWELVNAIAARERALAPLFERLQRVHCRAMPAEEHARLQRLALVSQFQLISLHDRLAKLLTLFAANGIEVLLLKGAGLAYSAYAKPTDRPMGDIDILVRDEVAPRAWQLAVSNGWRRRTDVPKERSYDDHQHLTPLEDSDGLQVGLELHISLFTHQAPFQLPASQMWEGARRVTIGGASAFVPSVEDQLLHAALHFAWSHEMSFGVWRTIRDVERIVALNTVDWRGFVEKSRASRGATCSFWTLRLARDVAGVEVPDEVLAALAPKLPGRILQKLVAHYTEHAFPRPGGAARSVSMARALWSLGVRPRSQGHGPSRPWLDTEEWVRGPEGMRNVRASGARRILAQSFGFFRSVMSLMGS